MNKVLIIMVRDNGQGFVDAGGLDLSDVHGVREAINMTEFARSQMTEALVQMRARELAQASEGGNDDED